VLLGRDVRAALAAPSAVAAVPRIVGAPAPAPPAPGAGAKLFTLLAIGVPIPPQSYDYVLFLLVVGALFYALPRRMRWAWLLLASYYFYARWNASYVVLLAVLTLSDFIIALLLARPGARHRRLLLALGVGANLAFLGTFKYANFLTGNLAAALHVPADPWLVSWLVPIGISFHTFQSISYLVDVHRGRVKPESNLLHYALYIGFFPQLLAGPIVRAGRYFGELHVWQPPDLDQVERGLREIVLGTIKKLVIADQFAPIADAYFGALRAHPGAPAAWCAVFAFTLQIYFDFSGYSDIAIGSARLLGFVFPENFRRPYLAAGITDFWRRWHISLSTWLRDYLYIPLGGNRDGIAATLRNLMLTMLLGGLWHGASWTFVAWGGYHGVCSASSDSFAASSAWSSHAGWRACSPSR
jgi:D-alanyl-lipoteichoic acid acyltransferase DltB (MBOAT superfamily)